MTYAAPPRRFAFARRLLRFAGAAAGSLSTTLALFLVLPLLQSIGEPPVADLSLVSMDVASLPPPPPPPPEEEPEEEPEPEETPPELEESAAPLDLAQLELALGAPGLGDGWFSGDFAVRLETAAGASSADEVDRLFSLADLDQKPRVVHQPGPVLTAEARKRLPGAVHVLFVVDADGRVVDPVVQHSSDPALERPALAAVKQWKFEPGKRDGRPVRFRMRVPITFPEGG